MTLLDLAARVEALTGPCRETDEAIHYSIRYVSTMARIPRYTASLDAAMTLVPKGLDWSAYNKGQAVVWPRDETLCGNWANAATPALGLTAAAIRARAAA